MRREEDLANRRCHQSLDGMVDGGRRTQQESTIRRQELAEKPSLGP